MVLMHKVELRSSQFLTNVALLLHVHALSQILKGPIGVIRNGPHLFLTPLGVLYPAVDMQRAVVGQVA